METDSNIVPTPVAREHQPSSPELQAAIKQLNVDTTNARFMKLVDDMLRPESLPRGWAATFEAADSKWVYKDKHGQLHDKHPVHDYYIGAMFMDRGGYARLKQLAAERPPAADEVKQMGLYLNIKEGEDKYLWQVAEMALSAPLPPEWEEAVEGPPDAPQVKFRNKETGVSMDEHPLDNYFRELLRRRRRELLRRKKAALKALQALVRMGGARRGMLANLIAQKKAEDAAAAGQHEGLVADLEEDELDLDSVPPAVQTLLLSAWQGLVGSAVHMVKSMQAAHWDSSNNHSSSVGLPAPPSAAASHGRLQMLCNRLSTAMDPTAAGDSDAAAALQDIEQLAAQAAAAGDAADNLEQVLAGQGIVITIGGADGSFSSRDSQVGDPDNKRTSTAAAGYECSSKLGNPATAAGARLKLDDPAGKQTVVLPAALSDIAEAAEADGVARITARRPSTDHPQEGPALVETPKKKSFLAGKLSFLQVSNSSASSGPAGRLSHLLPGHGPSTAANSSSSGAYMNLGAFSSAGGAADAWSLSGGAPTAAGIAAARNVRANAALLRDAEARDDLSDHKAAAVDKEGIFTVGGTFRRSELGSDHTAQLLQGCSDQQQDPNRPSSQPYRAQAEGGHNLGQAQQQQQHSAVDGRLGFFLGIGDLPPLADAALQHMSALQAVIVEATGLIKSWQQQRLIILLLQQRLAAAVFEVHAGQARLSEVMNDLDQIRQTQQQQSDSAVVASAEYQKLQQELESATKELERLKSDTLQSQQGSEELQQALEAAVAAAAAATAQQQQLQEQLAAVKEQLRQGQEEKQEQQRQLDDTKAELNRLSAEYTQRKEVSGSEAAATAAQLAQLQSEHQQLQIEHAKLQETLTSGQVAAAAADTQQQQLVQQLQQTQQELAAVQAAHAQLQAQCTQQGQQLVDVQTKYQVLQVEHDTQSNTLAETGGRLQQLQQQYEQTGGELGDTRLEVKQLQGQLELSKQQHEQLEQQRQQLQDQISNQGRELSNVSQQLSQAQQQLTEAQQQHQQLEQQRQQLQEQFSSQGGQLTNVSQQLSHTQQQLAQAQQHQQRSQQQIQQLESQNEKALEDQIKLMDVNTNLMKDIKDMKAAAEAAEQQRLSKPSKVCQITAVDAEQQHWTKSRSVQTGEELDPRSKRDVGTAADLALLSYFFREIKQKQRGGGGAIIGYDPENAREAAAVACSPTAMDRSGKSWTGGPLPGIQVEAKRAASMPGGLSRPHTSKTGGTASNKKAPEPELIEGNLDLRPVPWEVKSRVDRRRDRDMMLENETAAGAAGDHDKWDYSHDERDNEIAELKKRLIEQDRKGKDAATKASEDLRVLSTELQSTKHTAELLQSDNFTLRKEINSLRIAMQAVGMTLPPVPDSLAGGPKASTVLRSSFMAARPSVMSAPQGLAGRASVYAKEGPAPRSSIYGRPRTTSSLTGSAQSSASGAGLSIGGSVPLPGSSTAGNSIWGSVSGAGAGGILSSAPGAPAGFSGSGAASSNNGANTNPIATKGEGLQNHVSFLSLTGGPGTQVSGLQKAQQMHEHGTGADGVTGLHRAVSPSSGVLSGGAAVVAAGRLVPSPRGAPGQQLLPTIRSSVANMG